MPDSFLRARSAKQGRVGIPKKPSRSPLLGAAGSQPFRLKLMPFTYRSYREAPSAARQDMEIDLNCDLGEGGPLDAELMPLITSANIACGFHAGGPAAAFAALRAAAHHGVRAGAHPGFADREHFGRRELDLSEQQIYEDCVYQIGALMGLARAAGVTLGHVKPHGGLYNRACRDDAYARPVVAATELFGLALVGLPGSRLEALSRGRPGYR